ncbi:MAG: MBL fold metallo-hydrolase [Candidatus Tectomicrobia bacterium]|uniref:MBL fold metallo-hydrolase n=1 Tax=Tectimicrobiota bacterium TaxID=2528274 RepID=A0A933LR13_UNCTE|nr:MBL fold metallo-hydrolase [Candidatus Tectomicrobia bacterium]
MHSSPCIHAIFLPTKTMPPAKGTNAYLIGTKDLILVDPGDPNPESIEKILNEMKALGGERITDVIITHAHPDHYEGADSIFERTGARFMAHELTAQKISGQCKKAKIDLFLRDNQNLNLNGLKATVIHSPGHSPESICLYLEDQKALISGDTIVGFGTVVISPPDGDMSQYLNSLRRLLNYHIERIYPGHGPIVEEGKAKIEEYIQHRLLREYQILKELQSGTKSVKDLVKVIYQELDIMVHGADLHERAERSVLAHLIKLETENKVIKKGQEKDETVYALQDRA